MGGAGKVGWSRDGGEGPGCIHFLGAVFNRAVCFFLVNNNLFFQLGIRGAGSHSLPKLNT